VAVLGPIPAGSPPRRRGVLTGQIRLGPEFDAPLPEELLAAFEGPE
jgi:hypothetical protein